MGDEGAGVDPAQRRSKRRRATLYDAAAGRVNYKGFMPDQAASRYRDTADTSTYAVPPDEVLFRRRNAPLRFAENDVYRADRQLPADKPLLDIHAFVYIERPSQKGIIIGPKGERLKKVGIKSRKQIEALLGTPVFLDLHVKVAKDWQRDPRQLRKLGF